MILCLIDSIGVTGILTESLTFSDHSRLYNFCSENQEP